MFLNPNQKPKLQITNLETKISDLLGKNLDDFSIGYKNLAHGKELIINLRKMVSASVIKLFIMIDAFKQQLDGTLRGDTLIVLKDSMKIDLDSSLYKCPEGAKISIQELITLMITESDNVATNILIDLQGMDRINQTIRKLGCSDTSLNRKMLDFENRKAGIDNYTSVGDLLMIFEKIYKKNCIAPSYDSKMIEILKGQKTNTKIPALLPSGTIVAHKTGELDNIENDAGIVFDTRGDYILCIMADKTKSTSKYNQLQSIRELSKAIFYFNVR